MSQPPQAAGPPDKNHEAISLSDLYQGANNFTYLSSTPQVAMPENEEFHTTPSVSLAPTPGNEQVHNITPILSGYYNT